MGSGAGRTVVEVRKETRLQRPRPPILSLSLTLHAEAQPSILHRRRAMARHPHAPLSPTPPTHLSPSFSAVFVSTSIYTSFPVLPIIPPTPHNKATPTPLQSYSLSSLVLAPLLPIRPEIDVDEGEGGGVGGVGGGRERPRRGVAGRRRAAAADGHGVDGERAHHHGRDRLRRAVPGVGDRAARLGGGPRRHAPLRLRHLLHLHAPRRVLPLRRRPHRRQAELHLHGRRPRQPRRLKGQAMRRHPVRQPLRRRHRLHHRRVHQHAGDQEGGLLPRQGPQEPVPELQQPVHDLVRRRRGRLLADPGLRPDMVALHRRCRHVLHLLHHRPRARRHADRRQRRVPRQPHRRRRRRRRLLRAEDLPQPPGLRQHRLRLLLRHHPDRDPGHDQGAAAVGGQGDEEGDDDQRGDDDHLLHAVRVHGVRGVRRRRPGQPPHGVRLLRALLAPRHRQRRHRRAPRRRVPGLLPAALRLRREVGGGDVARQRLHRPGGQARPLRPQRVPPYLAHGVRRPHHRHRHAPPLLRRRRGAPRRRLVLAAHRLLPRRDVHRAARRAQGEHAVGVPADAQRRLPVRVRRRRRRLHCRRHRRAQGVPPVQRLVLGGAGRNEARVPWTCFLRRLVGRGAALTSGVMSVSFKEMERTKPLNFCGVLSPSTLLILRISVKLK